MAQRRKLALLERLYMFLANFLLVSNVVAFYWHLLGSPPGGRYETSALWTPKHHWLLQETPTVSILITKDF
jgi:hypothetical protein